MILLLWSLRALAVIVLGGLTTLALRRRSAATRTVVLRATLLAAWLIPLVTLVAPRIEVRLPEARPAMVTESEPIGPMPTIVPTVVPSSDGSESRAALLSSSAPTTPFPWLPAGYVFVCCLLVARWFAGYFKLRRISKDSVLVEGRVRRAADDSLGVPATFGWLRSTILMPRASSEWPEARSYAAILHEEAHVRAHDWAWQCFAGLFAAIHWFNPAAWLLVRVLRDTAETAADDAVLAAGLTPSSYARELLEVARTARPVRSALTMARRGGVSDRVVAILTPARDRSRPTWRVTLATIIGVAGSAMALAGIRAASDLTRGAIELSDIREVNPYPSSRWDALGRPVATPDEVAKASFIPGLEGHRPGGRQIEIRFGVQNPIPDDDFNVEAKGPAEVTYWLPEKPHQRLNVALFVPNGASTADLKVGRASGNWEKIETDPRAFVQKPMGSLSGKRILVRIPKTFEADQTKIVCFDRDGQFVSSEYIGYEIQGQKRFSMGHVLDLKRAVASVQLWHRPYVWKSFPNVPLAPASVPQALGPQKLASGRVVQLAGLQAEGKSWDGSGKPASFPMHEFALSSIRKGWRRMAVGIRMTGSDFSDLPVRVTAWGKYAYPSGDVVWEDLLGKPHEKIAWCSLQIRPDVKTANFGVDLYSGPWRTDVDAAPGKGAVVTPGRIVRAGNRKVQQYAVGFEGYEIPGQDRYCELSVYNERGLATTSLQTMAYGPGGTYTVFLPVGQKISRVVLRSRALEHVRFGNVKMWPG